MEVRLSAGGIIVGKEKKLVLVEQGGNSWSFPKGGVEGGESLLEAAKREIFEETGFQELILIEELGTYERYSIAWSGVGEERSFPIGRRTLFLFHTDETTFVPTDGEITDARFVTIEEALTLLTHPKDAEFLRSVEERIRRIECNLIH